MSTLVTYAGNQYRVPAYQDTGYAQGNGNLSSYLIALATGSLTVSGGSFPLTADANFGASFGLVSIYFTSRTINAATAGAVRLANTDKIEWRDNANANNLILAMNATQTGGGTYTIPDIGAGISASFVMTAGTQTIGGTKTFSTAPAFSAGLVSAMAISITAVTNQIILGTTNTTTVSATAPASSAVYTIPDVGTTANFILSAGTQTVGGSKTFSSAVTVTAASSSALIIQAAQSGSQLGATIDNTSNTASSDVRLFMRVGGTSAGNPYVVFSISGSTGWSHGIDNADNDSYKVSQSTALGINDYLIITTGGQVQIGNGSGAVNMRVNTSTTTGAGLGTLTNAPAAGNPTGYVQISINGTTGKIPYWT